MATSPPTQEDQGRLLEEALGVVRQQAVQMRKCLETPGKLMDALKCGFVSCSLAPMSPTTVLPAMLTSS